MSTKRLYFSNEPSIKTSMFSRYASAYNGFSSHQSILYESKRFSLFNAVSLKDYGDVKMGKRRSHGFNEWGKCIFLSMKMVKYNERKSKRAKILASNNLILLINVLK